MGNDKSNHIKLNKIIKENEGLLRKIDNIKGHIFDILGNTFVDDTADLSADESADKSVNTANTADESANTADESANTADESADELPPTYEESVSAHEASTADLIVQSKMEQDVYQGIYNSLKKELIELKNTRYRLRKKIIHRKEIIKTTINDIENINKDIRQMMEELVYSFPGDRTRVFVKTLTGKTITLSMSSESPVWVMKYLLQECDNTPISQQRMIFSGHQLEDKRAISSYNITNKSTCCMILRLRGGMFVKENGCDDYDQNLAKIAKLENEVSDEQDQIAILEQNLKIFNQLVIEYTNKLKKERSKQDYYYYHGLLTSLKN